MANFYPGVPNQGQTLLNQAPTTSAATTAQTVTITGTAGSSIVLRKIVIFGGGTATLQVKAGATVVLDFGTLSLTAAAVVLDCGPYRFAPGVNCVLAVGAPSAGTTTISCSADQV